MKELALVARRAEALRLAIEALHLHAIEALGFKHPWPGGSGGLATQLRILECAAQHAQPSEQGSAGMGAKVKAQPQAIARIVGCHYLGLTGRIPTIRVRDGTAYGPFLELLTQVFDCLGVAAKPESQARSAIDFMKKTPREQWPLIPLDEPPKV